MKRLGLNISNKLLITCIVIIITIVFICASYAMQGETMAKLFGKQQQEIFTKGGDGIIAVINGKEITKSGFDAYKFIVNYGGNKLTDEQVFDKILEREVIYQEAIQAGLVATNEEIMEVIEYAKNVYKENDELYSGFKDYISGMNMTEEQYWESAKPAYKKFRSCGKLIESLKKDFEIKNNTLDKAELDSRFKDYYNQYVESLKKKAVVEAFNKP